MVLYDAEIQSSAAGQVPTNQSNDLFVLIRRTRIYPGNGVSGFVGRGPLGSLDRHTTTPIRTSYSTPIASKPYASLHEKADPNREIRRPGLPIYIGAFFCPLLYRPSAPYVVAEVCSWAGNQSLAETLSGLQNWLALSWKESKTPTTDTHSPKPG